MPRPIQTETLPHGNPGSETEVGMIPARCRSDTACSPCPERRDPGFISLQESRGRSLMGVTVRARQNREQFHRICRVPLGIPSGSPRARLDLRGFFGMDRCLCRTEYRHLMRNGIPTSAITLDFGRTGRRIHRFDTETFGLHILPGFFRLFGQGILP